MYKIVHKCIFLCACVSAYVIYFNFMEKQQMVTMWHKTQNKQTGQKDLINSSWEFHGSSSPRAASVNWIRLCSSLLSCQRQKNVASRFYSGEDKQGSSCFKAFCEKDELIICRAFLSNRGSCLSVGKFRWMASLVPWGFHSYLSVQR